MNKKIERLLEDDCKKWGYIKWSNDEELYRILREFGIIDKKLIDNHRWWNNYWCVIKIEDTFIGYIGADTTGDESAEEKGWEFDADTICEMKQIKKTIITYIKKEEVK